MVDSIVLNMRVLEENVIVPSVCLSIFVLKWGLAYMVTINVL